MFGRRNPQADHRRAPDLPRQSRSVPVLPVVLLVFGGAGYLAGGMDLGSIVKSVEAASNCDIKGNISIETGERIYHVPGQPDYGRTKISPQYGERWFCSEEEARRAGWRRARN